MSIYESVFRTTLRVHAFIYEHTDGLIGHRMLGVPCLMLRTTGRKTGQTRTNSLVYAKDADRYLVVASKGGDPKAPAWLLNLRAKPEVQVQIGHTRFQATATEIGPDDPGYASLWKLVNDNNGNRYDAYQKKTTRPIPVVALSRTTLRALEHAATTSRSPRAMAGRAPRRTTASSPTQSCDIRRRKSESGRAEPGRRTLETGRKRPRSDSGLIVAARVGEDPLQALGRACWTATDQLTPDLSSPLKSSGSEAVSRSLAARVL